MALLYDVNVIFWDMLKWSRNVDLLQQMFQHLELSECFTKRCSLIAILFVSPITFGSTWLSLLVFVHPGVDSTNSRGQVKPCEVERWIKPLIVGQCGREIFEPKSYGDES
ncbi:hypothetical protein L6452_29811 [Arctium lappa]|uniref:Uncharacterized protein n=1 Tax=Arctium lappa TaxID=4217 RepID=A0ACB8ZLQ8_ARCLA|nr:hypothetical protein L6452_29811 [Arctium lappa]